MNKDKFAEIITSAWYLYVGLEQEELIKTFNYEKDNVETGAKLCIALKNK